MAETKTKVNDADVEAFIDKIEDGQQRADSSALLSIFTEITSEQAKMWGSSIIGFGQYHYKSERSSQEGDWMLTGFSPRKQNISLYIMPGFAEYDELLGKLGKHKTGKSCLYIKSLADVDIDVLKELIGKSYIDFKKKNSA